MSVYSISTSGTAIQVPNNSAWKTPRWTWAFRAKIVAGINATGVFGTSLLGNGTTAGVGFELYGSVFYFDMPGYQIPFIGAGDSTWHHYAATYDGSTVKLYCDGSLVVTQGSVPAVSWGADPLTIASFSNTLCRLTDPRIYSEALSGADVAALASGTDVTTNLVMHWPCTEGTGTTLADTVGGHNASGSISWISFDNEPTGPYVESAMITPSFQWLRVTPLRIDQTSALNAISAVADGATYTVGGVTRPLLKPFFSVGSPHVMWPLGECSLTGHYSLDDGDSACTSTGTWDSRVQEDAPGGRFEAFGAEFKTSTTGTFSWPFTALAAKRYSIYITRDVVDVDRTTQAVYTIKDGTGSTIGTPFTVDLTQQLSWHAPRDANYGPELHRLGYVDLPDGQTSLTVTLSNGAGSGLLVADAVILEPEFRPTVQAGDVVTVSLPAGSITVGGLPLNEAINFPVTLTTDAEFFGPILPPDQRTIKCSYNIHGPLGPYHVLTTANRGWSSGWEGSVTLDDNHEMTANTGTASRLLTFWPLADGNLTTRGNYTLVDGVNRFEFNVSGGTFDSAAQANVSVEDDLHRCTVGPATFTSLGGGRWRMEQSVVRPAWQPISERTQPVLNLWSYLLQWRAHTPGLVYTNWKWFDPSVPTSYTKTAHPAFVAQVTNSDGTNWVHAGRMMDILGTNGSMAWRQGDFLTPADEAGGNTGTRIMFRANIISIRPLDFDGTGDPDKWHRFWASISPTTSQTGWFAAEVDDATGFGDGTGGWFDGPVRNYATTLGTSFDLHDIAMVKIGPTTLAIQAQTVAPYDTSGGTAKATLDATHAVTGSVLTTYKVANTLSYETVLDAWKDAGIAPWINIPVVSEDPMILWMAQEAFARTPDGTKVYVEYGNENWNPFFFQYGYMTRKANEANFLHAQDSVAHPYEYSTVGGYGWQAHRAFECRNVFRQVWTDGGRDPNLIQGLCGIQTQSFEATQGAAYVCQHEGATFEGFVMEDYQDDTPTGSVVSGPDLAGTFQRVDENGLIDSTWVNASSGRRQQWIAGHDSFLSLGGVTNPTYMAYEEIGRAHV